MESLGHEGLNKMLDGFEDRGAEAVCTFAFCRGPGEEPIIFQGRTVVSLRRVIPGSRLQLTYIKGKIVRPRGPTNFGEFRCMLGIFLDLY
jgi:inosine triphosphate pyrophosphatase